MPSTRYKGCTQRRVHTCKACQNFACARRSAGRIGNFWTDLVRGTLYILLPGSAVLALIFVQQGVIQNFSHYVTATTLEGANQLLAMGPVASQEAIKLLGETGEAYKLGFQERNEIRSYAYKNLGNAYNGLKRYDEAATALKKSSEIEPKNASAHFNLGLTLYNAGRYSEAIESYKEVIKLRPTLAPAYFNLGLTYYAINDKKAAMEQYESLKPLDAELAKQLYETIKR